MDPPPTSPSRVDDRNTIGGHRPAQLTGYSSQTTITSTRPLLAHPSVHKETPVNYSERTSCQLSNNTTNIVEEKGLIQDDLPPPQGSKTYQILRWVLFSTYRRLFTLVFASNTIALGVLLGSGSRLDTYNTSTAVSANLLLSILVRQEHVVNLLFLASFSLPIRAPLVLRLWCAKIYCYGGLHSGCGVAAVAWFAAYTYVVTSQAIHHLTAGPALVVICYVTVSLLAAIIITAIPTIRGKHHNLYEVVHRFLGWTIVLLFWSQLFVLAEADQATTGRSISQTLVRLPTFWSLIVITICIIYPWARLRRRETIVEPLSDHAVRLHFEYASHHSCMGIRLADQPLKETHAFAVIPKLQGEKGFSVIISNAGDWTKRIITSPPKRLWTKGIPVYGVLSIAVMFRPVVIVATGSGIGPCLSLFQGTPRLCCRVLWSTPAPLETYGREIVESVKRADSRAVIIDSRKQGRPDLVALTYSLYREEMAEAVVVISNAGVTKRLVHQMEIRGVPAYGPIWDS